MKKTTYKSISQMIFRSVYIRILLLLSGIGLFGCAYINTLYNARVAFNTTFKRHMKLKQSDADTSIELTEEIKSGYERAKTKAEKVVDVYPKRKRWHDDALFLRGKATYYLGDALGAIQRFEQFNNEFPESPYIPEATLLLGKAYLENDDLQKAEEIFQVILNKYPKLNANEEVTLLLAEVAIKREGKSQAIQILQESLNAVKTDEKKMSIVLKLCALYLDLAMYDNIIAVVNSAPRNNDYPYSLYRMDFYLLLCYKHQMKLQQALDHANKMLKVNKYLLYEPDILLEKGRVLKQMVLMKEAISIFETITAGKDKEKIIAAAWYELALIYQHHYGDFTKAKECYEKVITFPLDDVLKEVVQRRINGINTMVNYSRYINGIQDESTDSITNDSTENKVTIRYKLGEIYWLNLSEPDSALNHFTYLSKDTLTADSVRLKSLYARAWILRFIKKDTIPADSIFKSIIEKYPATYAAKKSQQNLGIPITIKTREDSARVKFLAAEKEYFDNNNPVAAVNAYYKVSNHYPDITPIAANSIYAAAWICDNVLHKNKMARQLYQKLCESYPQSDLCLNAATSRLQVVEDTLKVLQSEAKMKKTKQKKTPEHTEDSEPLSDSLSTKDHQDENILIVPHNIDTSEDRLPAIEPDSQEID